jgi:hypothetical protein
VDSRKFAWFPTRPGTSYGGDPTEDKEFVFLRGTNSYVTFETLLDLFIKDLQPKKDNHSC